MKILLIIAVTILAVGCKDPNRHEPELDHRVEEGEEITYLRGTNTLFTGTQVTYSDGRKSFETNYKDGKLDGFSTYRIGEWLTSQTNYKDGKRDGLQTYWYENGQKSREPTYKDGQKDGLSLGWHENGQKKWEANYKDGKSISEKYFNNKGELTREYPSKD